MPDPSGPAAAPVGAARFAPAAWGPLDGALLLYLAAPLLLFLPGFFVPSLGIPALLLAVVALWLARPCAGSARPQLRDGSIACGIVLVFTAAWVSLGGAGHTFFANPVDWIPRYGVLRDLVVNDWPPRYLDDDGRELLLRAPLGYYLVPAWLAKSAGLASADRLLLGWTWLGVTLFFLANVGGSAALRLGILLLFAAASGLDLVGYLWKSEDLPWLGLHIEWWTGRIKYSSNSTMLYWIPNHVIPGWVLGAWLWRFRDSAELLWRLPAIALAIILWSPLPVVGALPLLAVIAWRRRGELRRWLPRALRALLPVLPPALLVAAFVTMGAGEIRSWAVLPPPAAGVAAASAATVVATVATPALAPGWWLDTALFIFLEALLFGAIAWQCSRSPLVAAAVLLLVLLPFFSFGPTNDLATQGAIPALTVIWLTLIGELTAAPAARRLSAGRRWALLLLLLVGAATPFQESYRALTRKPWPPDTSLPAPVALRGFAPHYFAPASHWLGPALRQSPPLDAATLDWRGRRRP